MVGHVEATLSIAEHLPLEATVREVANKSNQFYSSSGVMILDASDKLQAFRQEVVRKLSEAGYAVEDQELRAFVPHVTVRLGVPLEGEQFARAQEKFEGRTIAFNQWVLFRLVKAGDSRTMREVRPV